ncbi:MAG: two-component sensor histidine kinase, partial [Aquabacterium sp.]|nr:two-component sensor histidine kinase [Ferruginibacter sp.]
MPFSFYKTRRLRIILIVYWFLLTYIIAALVYWFIALNQQNTQMADLATSQLKAGDAQYTHELNDIANLKKRKTAQYIGEGSIFLLLILSGAVFIYRMVRRQFKQGQQQQNFMMAITHELKTPIAIT